MIDLLELQLGSTFNLAPDVVRALRVSGAHTPEAALSLLRSFPSVSQALPFNRIGMMGAMMDLSATASWSAAMTQRRPMARRWPMGAAAPLTARWTPGTAVPLPPAGAAGPGGMSGSALLASKPPINHHASCSPWPVRDQGEERWTCVAFAVVALREALMCKQQQYFEDLSEQYLYWATKLQGGDPHPQVVGTKIEHALQALRTGGVAREFECGYNSDVVIGDEPQDLPPYGPSAAAKTSAGALAVPHSVYGTGAAPGGRAGLLYDLLAKGPVAVTLPVSQDPLSPGLATNWTSEVAQDFGFVLNPVPFSQISSGHAVCLTGFAPDPREPLGGYFIVRASWGTDWGRLLPHPSYHGPAPGYGQVSATYVEQFLWEYAQL